MLPTLLIVDDERATREGLRSALEEDFDVYLASNNSEALAILKSEEIQLLLTDLRLGGDSGMDLIDTAAKLPAPPMILMMTAYGSVDTAVEAMRRGAFHFVTKPLNLDEVEMLLKRALRSRTLETENVQLTKQVKQGASLSRLIGKSPEIKRVTELIEQVAPTRATILIEGESGTGKSTLLATLTKARPKIAGYPFTTLEPMLGIAQGPGDATFVMADIPGLIEGASHGRGLGDKFLKHIERTRLLLHLVDCGDLPMAEPIDAWRVLRQEVQSYSAELATRPTLVVATKVETDAARERAQALATAIGQPVLGISSATGAGLRDMVLAVWSMLSSLPTVRPD
jgi:ActR/RegA family two-component response regulator